MILYDKWSTCYNQMISIKFNNLNLKHAKAANTTKYAMGMGTLQINLRWSYQLTLLALRSCGSVVPMNS